MRWSASTSTALPRRDVLAAAAASGTMLTSGCLRRIRSITGWESRSQITLDIRTVPADADPYALRLARAVAGWFRAAGIDASVSPMSEQELLRSVLLEHDFDAFVGKLTQGVKRPDSLFPLVHSRYAEAPGWQNPFGYANLDVDAQLEEQRQREGTERQDAVSSIQWTLARAQPFTTLAFPDEIRAARHDRYVHWDATALQSARGYLRLEPTGDSGTGASGANNTTETTAGGSGGPSGDADTLRLVTTDSRITRNLNPLAAEFRRSGVVMDLLYDSLGYETANGQVRPWLADTWSISTSGDRPTISLSLRENCYWHDGEPVTGSDVEFTYALLEDTSASETDGASDDDSAPVPAPRFRGRSSLVEDVTVSQSGGITIELTDCNPVVGLHALTVPILPEHAWADRMRPASVSGIDFGPTTEAVVTENVPPVGSGPLQYVGHDDGQSLTLERHEDHFLRRDEPADIPASIRSGPAFETLEFQAVSSDSTATKLVVDGEADGTLTPVGASTTPRIGRASDVELLVSRSEAPYVLGYNVQKGPLANARFRNTLGGLIDQSFLQEAVFDGYADPAASPLAGTQWVPDGLTWDGEHPTTPFLGADGDLDRTQARDAFRDAGFVYDDGALLQGN